MKKVGVLVSLAVISWTACAVSAVAETKIVLIAGRPSHGPGEHEFNAGTKLLVKCLKEVPAVEPVFVSGGWPADESVFDGAKAVVFYMDGGGGHPMIQGKKRMETMRKLMDQGVGLACLHYAVEFPRGEAGNQLLEWLGGYYETGYSDNPHNNAEVVPAESHPITRGTTPFRIRDEWYFKIRFRPNDPRVTPILTARALVGHDRKTYTDQTVAWVTERKDGGRSFGFTGGHFHNNWANEDFRTFVIKSILWTAKMDPLPLSIKCDLTADDLKQNLDPKGKK
jgi:type 1 glutamine amidotransferase